MEVDRDEAGEEDDEEYEIEMILDAKQGTFEGVSTFCALYILVMAYTDVSRQGKLGYLVKWKGYSAESNSWVSEEEAV